MADNIRSHMVKLNLLLGIFIVFLDLWSSFTFSSIVNDWAQYETDSRRNLRRGNDKVIRVNETTCRHRSRTGLVGHYNCELSFDWKFYSSLYPNELKNIGPTEAMRHWLNIGLKEGKRFHPGPRTTKIILNTKDEWPMLKHWVIYHGHHFGFKNLYIINTGSSIECDEFLEKVQSSLGVNVLNSDLGLHEIIKLVNNLYHTLVGTSDFLIKVDTDEFVALNDGYNNTFPVTGLGDYMDTLKYDGHMYTIGRLIWVFPNISEPCDPNKDFLMNSANILYTTFPHKLFFPSWTFDSIELGSHFGSVKTGFNSSIENYTKLILIHYSHQCIETYMENNKKALISRQFIKEEFSKEQQIRKLKKCAERFPKECICNSCHKVEPYYQYLVDPERARKNYYSRFGNGGHFRYTLLREFIAKLYTNYAYLNIF